ncbi:Uncharacterized protein SCF082_LOCUS37328 [Durusdinium trenchii]|uniref:SMP-30/Gluconolactonase/LRE-like region domain-containing protein n=1 Tax=Durusdinium trenchii TaxID=1381693 RepID=A0ABP0PPC9_9DINO
MRLSSIAIPLIALSVAACSGSTEPVKEWELSGFENPESALPDVEDEVIYVSNVAGQPNGKDGNGYISKISPDGKMIQDKWVRGLHAPKGMVIVQDRLYVADIDALIEIDLTDGKIVRRHIAQGAKILNDVAADSEGRVYVSDWGSQAIWRFEDGRFEKWLESDDLQSPNGLFVESDKLIVAAWGTMNPDDFSTKVPGRLLSVDIADKTITPLGEKPIGNLDGIEPFDAETYIVSDWVAGKVFQIDREGSAKELLSLSQGSADLGFISGTRTAIIPLMMDNKVVAYTF